MSKIEYRITFISDMWWRSSYYGERYFPQYRERKFGIWMPWTDLEPEGRYRPRGVPQEKQANYAINMHKKSHGAREVVL